MTRFTTVTFNKWKRRERQRQGWRFFQKYNTFKKQWTWYKERRTVPTGYGIRYRAKERLCPIGLRTERLVQSVQARNMEGVDILYRLQQDTTWAVGDDQIRDLLDRSEQELVSRYGSDALLPLPGVWRRPGR